MKKITTIVFSVLFAILLHYRLQCQRTLELFSLPGLSIASNSYNDTGYIIHNTTFYSKKSIIDGKSYLEYHNKYGLSSFYRIDGNKVFQKGIFQNEDETLIYDFGLEIGDTIQVPVNLPPSGLIKLDFFVTSKDVITFLDNRERIRIILGYGSLNDALVWVEGIGQFSFNKNIECVKEEKGSIYLNVSEEECNKVSCKNIKVDFEINTNENLVSVENRSEHFKEIEWSMGDGSIYSDHLVNHEYENKGCYEISLTAKNSCGETERKSIPFAYCEDSLWSVQSELYFKEISMINDLEGFAISENKIYETYNSGLDWTPREINFMNDTAQYTFNDLKIEGQFGVIAIGNSHIESDLLFTNNYGQEWTELVIPELIYKWKPTISVDNEGNIILLNITTVFTSHDEGNTWNKTKLEKGSSSFAGVLYQGDKGLSVITKFEQLEINRSIIYVSYDYGRNFIYTLIDHNRKMNGISFIEETGYITTDKGLIKTEDKGITWDEIYSFYSSTDLRDIHFTDEENGIMISADHIYRTTDGGITWNIENCQNKFELQKLEVIDTIEYIRHKNGIIKYQPEKDNNCTSSIYNINDKPDVSVFPNPTNDKLFVEIENRFITSIKLLSIHGIEIQKKEYDINQENIDVSNLPKGAYVVLIQDDHNSFYTKMFLKN